MFNRCHPNCHDPAGPKPNQHAFYSPMLSDWQNHRAWTDGGSLTTTERATADRHGRSQRYGLGMNIARSKDLPWHRTPPDASDIAEFMAGPGIERLDEPRFEVGALQDALVEVLARIDYDNSLEELGFGTLPVTRRPGTEGRDPVDLSGRFWTRPDANYHEVPRDEVVDEVAYTELVPEFAGTYFEDVVSDLRAIAHIGRVRINVKQPYNANSWHRDPEPRIHVPIHTNPGCLFIVNRFCTHLPADGSAFFTDTRGYHSAFNGGEEPRVHLIAAVVPSSDSTTG